MPESLSSPKDSHSADPPHNMTGQAELMSNDSIREGKSNSDRGLIEGVDEPASEGSAGSTNGLSSIQGLARANAYDVHI